MQTTIGICYHVDFYTGLSKTPHDMGMPHGDPRQLGCQQSVGSMPSHTSCKSCGCLDHYPLPPESGLFFSLFWASGSCPNCLGPNVLCVETPASCTACVCLWSAIRESRKPQHLPLPNSEKVTLDELSAASLSSTQSRRREAPVPS